MTRTAQLPGGEYIVYEDDRSETHMEKCMESTGRLRAQKLVQVFGNRKHIRFCETIGASFGTVGKEISGSKRVPGVLTTGYGPETIRIHRNAENTGSSS